MKESGSTISEIVKTYKNLFRDFFPGFLFNIGLLLYIYIIPSNFPNIVSKSANVINLNSLLYFANNFIKNYSVSQLVIASAILSPVSGIILNFVGYFLFHKITACIAYLIVGKYSNKVFVKPLYIFFPGLSIYRNLLSEYKQIDNFQAYFGFCELIDAYFKVNRNPGSQHVSERKSQRIFFRSMLFIGIIFSFLVNLSDYSKIIILSSLYITYLLVFLLTEQEKLSLYLSLHTKDQAI